MRSGGQAAQFLQLGIDRYTEGRLEEAVECWRQALNLAPQDVRARAYVSWGEWRLQLPEDESVATTQERIFKAVYEYNRSKKGKLYPAKTVGEALENVPAKFFKETELWVKSKVPVLMLRTDNEIPKDGPSAKED